MGFGEAATLDKAPTTQEISSHKHAERSKALTE
jgi:hypothetical protein